MPNVVRRAQTCRRFNVPRPEPSSLRQNTLALGRRAWRTQPSTAPVVAKDPAHPNWRHGLLRGPPRKPCNVAAGSTSRPGRAGERGFPPAPALKDLSHPSRSRPAQERAAPVPARMWYNHDRGTVGRRRRAAAARHGPEKPQPRGPAPSSPLSRTAGPETATKRVATKWLNCHCGESTPLR